MGGVPLAISLPLIFKSFPVHSFFNSDNLVFLTYLFLLGAILKPETALRDRLIS